MIWYVAVCWFKIALLNSAYRETMMRIAPNSATKLHQILVTTTFCAPMSYFESIDNSSILNRFSQDMTTVGLALPISIWLVLSGMILGISI
jgi:ATP-binding cassette, subfamily C (CFTR/MRP), member 1